MIVKLFCSWKKIRQLSNCRYKASLRFKSLVDEFWPIEKRLVDIRNTLFKYYDNQIEETIVELGIEDVNTLNQLLVWRKGNDIEEEQHK